MTFLKRIKLISEIKQQHVRLQKGKKQWPSVPELDLVPENTTKKNEAIINIIETILKNYICTVD